MHIFVLIAIYASILLNVLFFALLLLKGDEEESKKTTPHKAEVCWKKLDHEVHDQSKTSEDLCQGVAVRVIEDALCTLAEGNSPVDRDG